MSEVAEQRNSEVPETEEDFFEHFAQLADESKVEGQAEPTDDEDSDNDAEVEDGGIAASSEDATAPAVTANDPWAGVDDTIRREHLALSQRYEKVQHDAQTARAAQSAMQKKVDELESRLAKQATVPDTLQEAADQSGVDLNEFREIYPEIAAAIDAMQKAEINRMQQAMRAELEAVKQQVSSFQQPVEEIRSERQVQQRLNEINALSQAHPDYVQIQQTPDFWDWVGKQPAGVRSLVESSSAQDNIVLLNFYKSTRPSAPPANTKGSRTTVLPRDPTASEAPPRKQGAPRTEGIPEDADAAFDYWARRADQGRT